MKGNLSQSEAILKAGKMKAGGFACLHFHLLFV
jgi:hypothetical protein